MYLYRYISFSAYGSLTVRSLLDMREHCLTEFDFPDPYLQVSIVIFLFEMLTYHCVILEKERKNIVHLEKECHNINFSVCCLSLSMHTNSVTEVKHFLNHSQI